MSLYLFHVILNICQCSYVICFAFVKEGQRNMATSPVEYTIGGVKIHFPCKAYPSQLAMMNSVSMLLLKVISSLHLLT